MQGGLMEGSESVEYPDPGVASSSRSYSEQSQSESSMDPLQALERIMHRHPSLWDRSAIEGLFEDLEELELGQGVPDRVCEIAQHVRKALLEPLVRLSLTQEKLLRQEQQISTEKKQQAALAMVVLLEERNMAIQQFQEETNRKIKANRLSDTLLRDLDEMSEALDKSRQTAKQAKRLLAAKEAEVQRLLDEKHMLLKIVTEAGPWELWEWIKREIKYQELEPGPDFEKRWLGWLAATGRSMVVDPTYMNDSITISMSKNKGADEARMTATRSVDDDWLQNMDDARRAGLLWVILTIVLQEGASNLRYVLEKGFFFLPMAWFYFWVGLSSRITQYVTGDILSRVKSFGFALHLI